MVHCSALDCAALAGRSDTRIRIGVPSVVIATALAAYHAGMATNAKEHGYEAFGMALQEFKNLNHLLRNPAYCVRDVLGMAGGVEVRLASI